MGGKTYRGCWSPESRGGISGRNLLQGEGQRAICGLISEKQGEQRDTALNGCKRKVLSRLSGSESDKKNRRKRGNTSSETWRAGGDKAKKESFPPHGG